MTPMIDDDCENFEKEMGWKEISYHCRANARSKSQTRNNTYSSYSRII